MNWAKNNPFLAVYLVVTALALAGVGYFTYNAFTAYETATTDYDKSVSKLQNLQNRVPFPSQANLTAYSELTSAYATNLNNLMTRLSTMQFPKTEFTREGFQDHLRQTVSEITQKASANGVTLPDGFYLGFDEYRGALPPETALASLAEQLEGIRTVVTGLIDLKVVSITSIARTQVQEERTSAAPRATPAPGQGARKNDTNATKATERAPILVARPFDITFRADQTRVRQALNQIATANQFFIIRSLTIRNTQLEGPLRVVAGSLPTDGSQPTFTEADASQGQPAPAAQRKLDVIVGREQVDVSVRIEMIRFNLPETKK